MQRLIASRRTSSRALAAALASVALFSGGAFANDKIEENGETAYLARDFVFVDSPAIEGYLRALCQRLLDAKGLKLESGATAPNILVQSSDAFNAFTDANGNLIISTGALRAMESEDELAALLGHERCRRGVEGSAGHAFQRPVEVRPEQHERHSGEQHAVERLHLA
jgi:predicted Zn-dependent protease